MISATNNKINMKNWHISSFNNSENGHFRLHANFELILSQPYLISMCSTSRGQHADTSAGILASTVFPYFLQSQKIQPNLLALRLLLV